jgi:hypothetical protein
MRGWVMAGGAVVIAVLVAGMLLVGIQKQRLEADRAGCLFRFQQFGQFAATYSKGSDGLKGAEEPGPDVLLVIPPGTIPNPTLAPDQRLSWVCSLLPLLDQRQQPTADLVGRLNPQFAWDAEPNREVSTTRLNLFVCPGAVPDLVPGEPAVTQFVGLSGVGVNAAELPVAPPISPRAGCFRYDAPTPLRLIREGDGLSNTFLFAETANDLGPWIRGGSSTVRGLDDGDGAKPALGRGGQFGGNYPGVVGFGRADGSAGFFTDRMSTAVLRAHLTIAGGEADRIPGED